MKFIPRRLLRFSLRTLLICVTLVAVACGWLTREYQHERARIDFLKRTNGCVQDPDFEYIAGLRQMILAHGDPPLIRRLMGGVNFSEFVVTPEIKPADLAELHRAYPEASLVMEPPGVNLYAFNAPQPTSWAVHRQDDNGNRFVMATGLSRADAERMVAEFESRGHKQIYWIAPVRPE